MFRASVEITGPFPASSWENPLSDYGEDKTDARAAESDRSIYLMDVRSAILRKWSVS